MITPPPIIAPRRKWLWMRGLVFPAVCVAVMFLGLMYCGGFLTPAVITEDDYLHDVKETPATLAELGFRGSVIATRRNTLTLYTADEQTTFYTSPWRIYGLAGPNKQGHLVVFEINQGTDEYRFLLADFNAGTTRVAHKGFGKVISDTVVGEMVMHPIEDKVVYFNGTGHRQYPGAYMEVGKMVELDLTTEAKTEIATDVVENEFAISADGDSVFFSRSTADAEPQIAQKILSTGDLKPLGPGWDCSLSFDSTSLIVFDRGSPVRSIDLKSGKSKPLEDPDYYFWPIATVSSSLVLAQSLPLNRETARRFPPTGSISGPHLMMRLGVFEPKKQRAAILRTDLDRYEPVAFSAQKLTAKAFSLKP
jgi:hypothetical protein